ncbi:MAG: hypothetical protein KAH05_00090 [Clostridiales bacterium]|jgi:hypothetical protein|nr:hypothetical protein [Clostridiales bacterium]
MNKKTYFIITLLLIMILLTGCLPGNDKYEFYRSAGFLSGIWHGWLAPLSLIISFFNGNVHMYEINNTGFWYDFGFYMAIISGFGGLSLSRKKKKKKK